MGYNNCLIRQLISSFLERPRLFIYSEAPRSKISWLLVILKLRQFFLGPNDLSTAVFFRWINFHPLSVAYVDAMEAVGLQGSLL